MVSGSTSIISRSSAEICQEKKCCEKAVKVLSAKGKSLIQKLKSSLKMDLWDVVVSPLPLLLLELDGDSSDGAALDPFHQVGHIPETNTTTSMSIS